MLILYVKIDDQVNVSQHGGFQGPFAPRAMTAQVLQLNPILIPEINDTLASRYTVHKLFEMAEPQAWLAAHGASVDAVITGGHTGITRAMLEQLPTLKVVAVNGVGTDAVDLAYCRARGLPVTATLGALTEDVADLAIGLLIAASRNMVHRRPLRARRPVGAASRSPAPSRWRGAFQRHARGHRRHGAGGPRRGAPGPPPSAAPSAYTDLRADEPMWQHRFVPTLLDLARDVRRTGAVRCGRQAPRASSMRPGAAMRWARSGYLVNVARGRLVNEADLAAADRCAGQIAGAGLDVFVDEPRVPAGAAPESDRVTVLQAHRASATWETRAAMGQMVLDSNGSGAWRASGRR